MHDDSIFFSVSRIHDLVHHTGGGSTQEKEIAQDVHCSPWRWQSWNSQGFIREASKSDGSGQSSYSFRHVSQSPSGLTRACYHETPQFCFICGQVFTKAWTRATKRRIDVCPGSSDTIWAISNALISGSLLTTFCILLIQATSRAVIYLQYHNALNADCGFIEYWQQVGSACLPHTILKNLWKPANCILVWRYWTLVWGSIHPASVQLQSSNLLLLVNSRAEL